jgi:hypothetical protein
MQKASCRLNHGLYGGRPELIPVTLRLAERGILMARLALPGPRHLNWVRATAPLLVVRCTSWHAASPVPPELTPDGVAMRVLASHDLNVNPAETVAKPGAPEAASSHTPASQGDPREPTTFTLPDVIAFALRNSPRLRSARAAIERARGQEQVAFAHFLPQIA